MARTAEADLKDKVKKLLSGIPRLWYFMPVPTGFGVRGIPDFVGCWEGRFFAIETKAIRGKETPWQKLVREKVLQAGGMAIVAYTIEEVHAFFAKPQSLRIRHENPGTDNAGHSVRKDNQAGIGDGPVQPVGNAGNEGVGVSGRIPYTF